MEELIQLFVNGLILGSVIALSAIGLTLVYGILNLANFAHGDYLTMGTYIAFLFAVTLGFNMFIAFIAAMAATALIGILLDRLVWKPMRDNNAGLITLLITSIGVAFVLRNLVRIIWGNRIRTYSLPIKEGINVLGARITEVQVIIIISGFALMFMVHYLLKNTTVGKAMRASSDNLDLARISGIDVDKVIFFTWIVTSALAAAGGIMLGLDTHIRPTMGWNLLIAIFAAVILGGIGNPYGAMAGGLIIGMSQELSVAVIPSEYKPAVAFVILILVLFIRPRGIFRGER